MGRQFRQLRAAVEIPLLRDLPTHEPALHLHGGLAARARALLSARRHACGGRLVSAGPARARVFEAVLLGLSAAGAVYRRPQSHLINDAIASEATPQKDAKADIRSGRAHLAMYKCTA